jgi:WD40 repeat protein
MSGKLLYTLAGHKDWVTSLSFGHQGKSLASASHDRTVKLWILDVAPNLAGEVGTALQGEYDTRNALAAATAEAAATARDAESAKAAIAAAGDDAKKKEDAEKAAADAQNKAKEAADKKTAAEKAAAEAAKKAQDLSSQIAVTLPGFKSTVWAVRFSPDGKALAAGSHADALRVWDVESKKERFAAQ